jgi:hypothetical protein
MRPGRRIRRRAQAARAFRAGTGSRYTPARALRVRRLDVAGNHLHLTAITKDPPA